MVNRPHAVFKASDRSYFAILKREIHTLAVSGKFNEGKVGEIDIIVAEMVTNLVKHAGGGRVLAKLVEERGIKGIEIICIDEGPGMTDVTRMVADGVSTKNTLGQGLGAMKRLADIFQIYSLKDWGTIILIRVFESPLPYSKKSERSEIRSVLLPKPGETECGDGFYYNTSDSHIKLFLGDGLGHGAEAAKAVAAAGEAFENCSETDPADIVRTLDAATRKTRGLVGTVCVFDIRAASWKICGVGNIITKVCSPSGTRNHLSYNGIIGLNVPRTLNAQEVIYDKGQHIIMCSDGIRSKWDTIKFPAITRYDFSILSAVVLKDFSRGTDDMSVAACKINL